MFNQARNEAQAVLPGVVRMLDEGRAAGLRIGLASNSGPAHVHEHLTRLGLRDRFQFIACRGDVPSPKPEPDLYRHVLNHFGIRGTEAIAFEDSHTGSLAAKRAGLWVVSVPNGSTAHHDFSPAHVRAISLAAVTLENLVGRFSPRA